MEKRTCWNCGSELVEGQEFCTSCGASTENVCPKCGTVLSDDDKECPSCKRKRALPFVALGGESAREAATASAPEGFSVLKAGSHYAAETVSSVGTKGFFASVASKFAALSVAAKVAVVATAVMLTTAVAVGIGYVYNGAQDTATRDVSVPGQVAQNEPVSPLQEGDRKGADANNPQDKNAQAPAVQQKPAEENKPQEQAAPAKQTTPAKQAQPAEKPKPVADKPKPAPKPAPAPKDSTGASSDDSASGNDGGERRLIGPGDIAGSSGNDGVDGEGGAAGSSSSGESGEDSSSQAENEKGPVLSPLENMSEPFRVIPNKDGMVPVLRKITFRGNDFQRLTTDGPLEHRRNDTVVTYDYTPDYRLARATETHSSQGYTYVRDYDYDAQGMLQRVRWSMDGAKNPPVIEVSHDAFGNVTRLYAKSDKKLASDPNNRPWLSTNSLDLFGATVSHDDDKNFYYDIDTRFYFDDKGRCTGPRGVQGRFAYDGSGSDLPVSAFWEYRKDDPTTTSALESEKGHVKIAYDKYNRPQVVDGGWAPMVLAPIDGNAFSFDYFEQDESTVNGGLVTLKTSRDQLDAEVKTNRFGIMVPDGLYHGFLDANGDHRKSVPTYDSNGYITRLVTDKIHGDHDRNGDFYTYGFGDEYRTEYEFEYELVPLEKIATTRYIPLMDSYVRYDGGMESFTVNALETYGIDLCVEPKISELLGSIYTNNSIWSTAMVHEMLRNDK